MSDRAQEIFYAALRAEFGIVVETNFPDKLVQEFYRYKRRCQNDLFNNLSFIISPDRREVWVLKENPYRKSNGKEE